MLKHGILGLLNYGSMTGYDIMLTFKDSLNFFWTAQTSQIYRELQTLKAKGWVTDESISQSGKPDKKLFSITESGKEELNRWLSEDDTGFETKSRILMKTFFRGERTIDENIEFFKRLKQHCEDFMSGMQGSHNNVAMYERVVKNPEKSLYWKMTVEYGIMYIKMLNEWTEKCIAELEEIKNEHTDD
ncbi:MAG: PadR family transcriptional regulator [Clostridia bacterium]|nr:PadR family transcriptional regulator [Clostridia bacterium]MBR2175558.1 PadR family transcriptional regulator [Clostridia bacterium]